MWLILQTIIAGAVLCANIYWQITPNGFVAALGAFGAAYAVTWLLANAIDWHRRSQHELRR